MGGLEPKGYSAATQEVLVVQEITEKIANNLSESEKQKKIDELTKYEKDIIQGIGDPTHVIHEMVFSSEKAIFVKWASTYKQLHYLGIYKDPLNTISKHIKKQIGRMNLPLDKKENLYRNVERSLEPEFKEERDDRQNVGENASDFLAIENSFLYKSLQVFIQYHDQFSKLGQDLLNHFKHPRFGKEIFDDFSETIEWKEIAMFCSTLEAMMEPISDLNKIKEKLEKDLDTDLDEFTTLQAIRNDLNMRESADVFRKAMYILLGADKSYRVWAHKFGISPRQNQRVRERLEDWPEKDVKQVIMKVLGSYLCPCGCGFNLVTGRKLVDVSDDKFYMQYKLRDKSLPPALKIPEDLKDKPLNPLQIAEKVWGKKIKLIPT